MNSETDIFDKLSRKLIRRGEGNKEFTFNQLTNIALGSASRDNQDLFSPAFKRYHDYFIETKKNFFRFDFERVRQDHPKLFGQERRLGSPLEEILFALDDELRASKKDTQKNMLLVEKVDFIQTGNGQKIYYAILEIEDDDEPKIAEKMPFKLRIGKFDFDFDVLEYNPFNHRLYFLGAPQIEGYYSSEYRIKVILDPAWLLEKVKERIRSIFEGTLHIGKPIQKFIEGKCNPQKLNQISPIDPGGELDKYQVEAIRASLSNDITLIWGPPGTGKSTTLARLLLNLYNPKPEKTVVVTIANVATDQIALKFVKVVEEFQKQSNGYQIQGNQFVRVGFSANPDVAGSRLLNPEGNEVEVLSRKIVELKTRKKLLEIEEEKISIQAIIDGIERQLKSLRDGLLQNAKIVFCTAAKFHCDDVLNSIDFDNLIVDEASMMSIPHFVALAGRVKKRIVVCGDFKQLGPVVLSSTELSDKWLHRDVFAFSGLAANHAPNHPALISLNIQRRFHPDVCSLISREFYHDQLTTRYKAEPYASTLIPFLEQPISYLQTTSECKRSKKGSRSNTGTCNMVLNILKVLDENTDTKFEIGVITPYRAQVAILKSRIREILKNSKTVNRIKVGTIHAFQGSEADVIIFDLVDSKPLKVGRLYQNAIGRRLFNVAMTRVKSKLIIVGDLDVLGESSMVGFHGLINKLKMKIRKFPEILE